MLVVVTTLTSCWESDMVANALRIRNATDRPIDVVVERVSGDQFVLVDGLRPRREQIVNPGDDPDADEGVCTSGPVIAFQDGEEIERFEPPVCFEDGLTLVVDGEP